MNDLLILGTDTDAGKTTFALLWMSVFADRYEYWKPVETGTSDSANVARLVPSAVVHAPHQRFAAAVAPPLAAAQEQTSVASARTIARSQPAPTHTGHALLIESFGSPFSPLNDCELQLTLIDELGVPCVLIASSALGAIGRSLQCLAALASRGIHPRGVVLVGAADDYAVKQIGDRSRVPVFSFEPPTQWDAASIRAHANATRPVLEAIAAVLDGRPETSDSAVSEALVRADQTNIWHPYTPLRGALEPLTCIGADAEFLHLADGRRVIDAISSWWTILHGHRPPELMRALAEAAGEIDHVLFAGVTHPWAVALAEHLLGSLPWEGGRVFYSDNGSTAVEVALKLAYQFWCHQGETQRTRFVGFTHAYHGDTFGAMAVGRDPLFFGRFEPLLLRADILPLEPDRLDEHLTQHRAQVAGVILEPLVQGSGGMRMHTPDTLRAIATIARRHDVLFIADEVMTGGGRTGTLWAHQAAGIAPDLVCVAKTLAGGVLPLAATLVAPRVVAAFDTEDRRRTFFHGHSFTAHPLACAVAVANFQMLKSRGLGAPAAMERFWTQAVEPLRALPHVRDIRIKGSIAAVELDVPGGYLADVGRRMHAKALQAGVFLRPLGSVVYAMPPFCTGYASLERIADTIHLAVRAAREETDA